MEQRRRTRSQGPPSPTVGNELNQWDSILNPVRIEREQAETCRLATQLEAPTNIRENMAENSEIPQETVEPHQLAKNMSKSGEILPKRNKTGKETHNTLQPGEISPNRQGNINLEPGMHRLAEISPGEPQQVIDLAAMEKGIQQSSPQGDTAEHYLDDNFLDVMRNSALGSNVSSLFNTTAFNNANNEHKVTLNWILPNGKNSCLETLKDKHIADFPAPEGRTGAMLVYLPDLELFYDTSEFLVDLQSGELFVKLQDKWHPTGLTSRKQDFEVEQLMALIQHASIRLKNKVYRKNENTDVLVLDPNQAQTPELPFIPNTSNYITHDKPMSPSMRKNYIKDRAQAVVTYIKNMGTHDYGP